MDIGFADGLVIVGLLLIGAAAMSGLVRRSVLSIAVLSVGAGIVLNLVGVMAVDPRAHAVVLVVELVLLVTLFSDGLLVELAIETVVGLAVGTGLALAAARLLDRLPDAALERRFEGLYALGVGLGAFGAAETAHGNGLIAAFSAGVVLAVGRHEVPDVFHDFNESVGSVLQVIAFAIFGVLVVETGFNVDVLPLAGFIAFALLVARPASVLLSFAGVALARPEKLFVAWFGPKGIASMLFALFVLDSAAPGRLLIFDVAAGTILASILAHGLSDTVGARWIERRVRGSG